MVVMHSIDRHRDLDLGWRICAIEHGEAIRIMSGGANESASLLHQAGAG
jgi:hypothetical protein